MKAVWNGALSFGLVNIPIKLFSAIESHSIKFRLLHKKDNSPISYKRYCDKEGKEVDWKEIVKGLEIEKEKFIVIDKVELEKIKPAKSDLIEILEFVDAKHIDYIYFNKHYFISPEKSTDKAYFLFREVLQSSNKIALGRFVMREKEYICTISAYKNGLLLSTLNYAYEIRNFKDLDELKNSPALKREEIKLAEELINKLSKPEFIIENYKDTYMEQLKTAIKRKEKGEIIEISKPSKRPTKNLVDALKASLK